MLEFTADFRFGMWATERGPEGGVAAGVHFGKLETESVINQVSLARSNIESDLKSVLIEFKLHIVKKMKVQIVCDDEPCLHLNHDFYMHLHFSDNIALCTIALVFLS